MTDTIRWIIREEVDYHIDISREEIIDLFAEVGTHTDDELMLNAGSLATASQADLIAFLKHCYEHSTGPDPLASKLTDIFADLESDANNNGEIQGSLRNFVTVETDSSGWDTTPELSTLLSYAQAVEEQGKTLTDPTDMADRVAQAFNQAADDVLTAADDDERLRDAVNLVVNAGMHYLDNPQASLEEAIEDNYDEDTHTVLSWI